MTRQNITMDAEYGEVETSDNIAGKSFHGLRLLDAVADADNNTFRHGEITIPVGFVYTYNDGKEFHVRIPYTPDTHHLTVRLIMENSSGGTECPGNLATGKHRLPIVVETKAGTAGIAPATFLSLNGKGVYNLLSRGGYLAVYNGSGTGFKIGVARTQNGTSLLKASAGSLYQHSTTGVGLVDCLHSSLENNDFAVKLQSEFPSDKVAIKNAYMDSAAGELLLKTEEEKGNDG